MIKKSIAVFLVALLSQSVRSEVTYLDNLVGIRQVSEYIVKNVSQGNISEAWSPFRIYSPMTESEKLAGYEQMVGKLQEQSLKWGVSHGYELISEEYIGTKIVRYTWVVVYERTPIRWVIHFYKKNEGWSLLNANYDANAASWIVPGANQSFQRTASGGR